MLEDGIKKKLTARLLALVVIISMISALTGWCSWKLLYEYEKRSIKGHLF